MINFLRTSKFLVRKLKNIPAQQWIVKPQDMHIDFKDADLSDLNIQHYRDVKRSIQRGIPQEQAKPISPSSGPITIQNPKIYNKVYKWCSCGQSKTQPLCDNSHKGTNFKPFKFTIEEPVRQIKLCGCKLTTKKPFCDGQSCKKLNNPVQ